MKRKISFMLSILMLMQVFFCLPIMAEEGVNDTPTTNLVDAVVGNSFMYADEEIFYIKVDGSFSFDDNEIVNATNLYRWAVYNRIVENSEIYNYVLEAEEYHDTYLCLANGSFTIISQTDKYTVVFSEDDELYVLNDRALSGKVLFPDSPYKLERSSEVITDSRKISEFMENYNEFVFVQSNLDLEGQEPTFTVYGTDAVCTVYSSAEEFVVVTEGGSQYMRTEHIAPVEGSFVAPALPPEEEIFIPTLCVGFDYIPDEEPEYMWLADQDDIDYYVRGIEEIETYLYQHGCMPYYTVEEEDEDFVNIFSDPDTRFMYVSFPSLSIEWAILGNKVACTANGKHYIKATDLICGYELIPHEPEHEAFLVQYDAHFFEKCSGEEVAYVVENGECTTLNYVWFKPVNMYFYDEQIVVCIDGEWFRVVYANGQYINNGTGSEPETEPDTEFVTETMTDPETESTTEPDNEVVTDPEVESETVAETEPEIEPETESESEAVTDPEVESETVTEPDTEADTDSGTEPETEPDTEPDTGSNTNPETTPVVKPKPTPVGKRFSFKRPRPIYFDMPVIEPEPLENFIVKPPFYRNRFLNVKFENFITWIRRSIK